MDGSAEADRHPLQRLWHRVQEATARARPEGIFLVVALAWGLLQVFIVPPLQVPDEGDALVPGVGADRRPADGGSPGEA